MDPKEKESRQYFLDVLDEYFSRGVDKKKFIDTSRSPLICQDIANIHISIEKIEGNINWGVKIILSTVVAGIIALLYK